MRHGKVATSKGAGLSVALCSCVLLSCARSAAPKWQGGDPTTWLAIRRALDKERGTRPRAPWAAGVIMTMREPHSGRTINGRGAIAVAPGRALRMILVGAAGATMVDAWVTPRQWRFAVPLAGVLRRGEGAEEPSGLPVGFLRWLFFRPLEGVLFGGSLREGHVLFLLRDSDAVLEVRVAACRQGELTTTTRRAHAQIERLDECRAVAGPEPGDWVRYEDQGSGLIVDLTIESVAKTAPPDDAFRDPDGDARQSGVDRGDPAEENAR